MVRCRTLRDLTQAVHYWFYRQRLARFSCMLAILERIDRYTSNIDLLVELFNSLRPKRPHDSATAIANVRTLRQLLKGNPAQARALHEYVLRVLAARRHASLYTDIGVLSNSGFFTELKRRIAYRMLPPALGDEYLNDALPGAVPEDRLHLDQQCTGGRLAGTVRRADGGRDRTGRGRWQYHAAWHARRHPHPV